MRGNYRSLVISQYEYADLYLPGDVHADLHADDESPSYEDMRVSLSDFPDVRLPLQCSAKNLCCQIDEPVASTSNDAQDTQPCYLKIVPNERGQDY